MIGILTDKFGRRKTIQIIYIPMALGWLIITFSQSYTTLLIGKIMLGLPFGEFYNNLFLNCMINSHKISYFKTEPLQ